MTTAKQRTLLHVGLAAAGLGALVVLLLSLSPIGRALADTLRGAPKLAIKTEAPKAAPTARVSATSSATTSPATTAAREDNAAMPEGDATTLKRVLQVDGPFRHGDYVWDEEGVPQGEVIITVDVKAQTIAVFRAGYQIGAAVVLYGADDYPTPLGTFPITQKDADHYSSTYNNAPMPYMLRLTQDGVAIHGSDVAWGYATHGCIGVPVAFARLLFAQAKIGTKVIVTSGKMMAVPEGAQFTRAEMLR